MGGRWRDDLHLLGHGSGNGRVHLFVKPSRRAKMDQRQQRSRGLRAIVRSIIPSTANHQPLVTWRRGRNAGGIGLCGFSLALSACTGPAARTESAPTEDRYSALLAVPCLRRRRWRHFVDGSLRDRSVCRHDTAATTLRAPLISSCQSPDGIENSRNEEQKPQRAFHRDCSKPGV